MSKSPNIAALASGFRSANKLNQNFEAIEAAFEKTLSRDGSGPNQMEAPLDMNSNRIINLPEPTENGDPVRLIDVPNITDIQNAGQYALEAGEARDEAVAATVNKADRDLSNLDASDAEAATSNLTVTQTGVAAVARPVADKLRDIHDARDWGCVQDNSTQTAKIQNAIDDLATKPGSVLNIPKGVKFDLGALVFDTNHSITLRYILNDEINQPGYVGLGSGEVQEFEVKSGYPTDPTGGLVGERGVSAPLHGAIVADTRADAVGASSALGPGQSLTETVRASWVLRHNLRDVFAGTYINHTTAPKSAFRGNYIRSYRQIYVLEGVGSSAWSTPPAVGDRVTTSGGGIGFVTEITSTTLTVLWAEGRISVGMTMGDSNESGIGPITSSTFSITEMSPLIQSLDTGRWSINKRPGDVLDPLSIGGGISVSPPDTFSQYNADASANWRFRWRRSNLTQGASIGEIADKSAARLWVYDSPDTGSARGMVGAVCASVAFTAGMAIAGSSLNIASITSPSTGDYELTFERPMANAEYSVQTSMSALMSRPASGSTFYTVGYEFVTATTLRIRVSLVDLVANTVTAANIPAGAQVSVTVLCGDIP